MIHAIDFFDKEISKYKMDILTKFIPLDVSLLCSISFFILILWIDFLYQLNLKNNYYVVLSTSQFQSSFHCDKIFLDFIKLDSILNI
jgi:hypothetical protein